MVSTADAAMRTGRDLQLHSHCIPISITTNLHFFKQAKQAWTPSPSPSSCIPLPFLPLRLGVSRTSRPPSLPSQFPRHQSRDVGGDSLPTHPQTQTHAPRIASHQRADRIAHRADQSTGPIGSASARLHSASICIGTLHRSRVLFSCSRTSGPTPPPTHPAPYTPFAPILDWTSTTYIPANTHALPYTSLRLNRTTDEHTIPSFLSSIHALCPRDPPRIIYDNERSRSSSSSASPHSSSSSSRTLGTRRATRRDVTQRFRPPRQGIDGQPQASGTALDGPRPRTSAGCIAHRTL